jgi:hypothetical protein
MFRLVHQHRSHMLLFRYKQVVPATKPVSCKLTTRTCILYLFQATTSIIAHILSLAHEAHNSAQHRTLAHVILSDATRSFKQGIPNPPKTTHTYSVIYISRSSVPNTHSSSPFTYKQTTHASTSKTTVQLDHIPIHFVRCNWTILIPSSVQQASLTHIPSSSQLVRYLNHAHLGQVDDCLPQGSGGRRRVAVEHQRQDVIAFRPLPRRRRGDGQPCHRVAQRVVRRRPATRHRGGAAVENRWGGGGEEVAMNSLV